MASNPSRLRVFFPLLALSALAAQPADRIDAGGWPNLLTSLLSQFANYDVLTLGEAHGRALDVELRLRLIRHPQLARDVRLIVAEFPDDRLTAAVEEANRQRQASEQLTLTLRPH